MQKNVCILNSLWLKKNNQINEKIKINLHFYKML